MSPLLRYFGLLKEILEFYFDFGSWKRRHTTMYSKGQTEMRLFLLLFLLLLLLASTPGSWARNVRRQSDTWGPWGEWSPCSRTCGGGISFRERPCYSQRRDGGASCVGPARSHRTCHTESCPDGVRDFRAEQCSEFDGTDFQGRRYRWLPYYAAPNKCELNCIPKGQSFYYKHRDAVVDGTPCEPGQPDICVDGVCRVVGCDHKLDSTKQEDKCLQCGGDGSSCYAITGTFDANDLSRGLQQIFIIPAGATSIRIEEAAASRNFLAVKSIHGEYYLNGHWTIEAAQALPVASTVLQYERGMEGDLAPERLQARGPISEPLVIELLSQESNPGVHYEYYLPVNDPGRGFSWSHGSWGDCSAECGGGLRMMVVPVREGHMGLNQAPVPPRVLHHRQRGLSRPHVPAPASASAQTVVQRAALSEDQAYSECPVWEQEDLGTVSKVPVRGNRGPSRRLGRWKVGPWTPCSASCGGGFQSRSVYCIASDGAGGQEAAEETQCAGLAGKPPATQACNLQHCAVWSVEPWGEMLGYMRNWHQEEECHLPRAWGVCGPHLGLLLEGAANPRGALCTRGLPRAPCPGLACRPVESIALKAVVPAFGGGRSFVPSGRPAAAWTSSRPSLPRRKPATGSPAIFLRKVPSTQDSRTRPSDPRRLLGPQVSPMLETSSGLPWRDPGLRATPERVRTPTCHLQAAPQLCSILHASRPRGPAPGPVTAGTALMGAALMATQLLLGLSGKAVPWLGPHAFRAAHGCCPDGVSAAEGPQQAGCTRSHSSDNTGNRPGSRAVASRNSKIHQPQAHESEPSECRSSSLAVAMTTWLLQLVPWGKAVWASPAMAYPVRCLLPSAQGSCGDWAARWYFVGSVGRCNRFWYGGCHGNANNFASEQECMNTCRGQQGPRRPEAGAAGHRVHVDGGHRGPGGQQEPDWHRTGATVPRLPSPSGSPWRAEQGPGPGEEPHSPAHGKRPAGQEVRPRVPGLDRDAGPAVPPAHSPSHRISLAGSEPSLVQAAAGQAVQLFCPGNIPPEFQAGWQREGRPIFSNRYQLQRDGSLIISPLRPEDAGIYSCGSHGPGHGPGHRPQKIQLQVTGDDMAVLSEGQPRHFPETRNPDPGHGPRNRVPGADAGGHRGLSSSHPRPATRLRLDRTQPGVVDASPGQRIRLTCRAEGFPVPTIEWQRDGQLVSSPRHQVQPDGSLVISRVAVDDGGFYTCVAFNGQDRDQRWVQLRVLRELTITGLPPAVTVAEGDTARLLCVVAGESVNIRWSRAVTSAASFLCEALWTLDAGILSCAMKVNGLPIQADGHRVHQSPDGTLVIHNLRPRDEGSYTCSAFRGSQAVSRSTEVKVALPAPAAQSRDLGKDCIDQPELANCALILQAQLCGNEYYSSFCCASCSRFQPNAQPVWQQG
ncbi:Papilin [Apodemus speciosus]|uniref:Papilin n=1 Tax=Apodemus speciosus TaxID=105296 RepID=A0ABQ0FED7_APOSI